MKNEKNIEVVEERKIKTLINRLLIFASILIVLSFISPFLLTQYSILDFTNTGEIGDTIGGIMNPFIALAGIILTYLAFFMQYKANQIQREQFEIQIKNEKQTHQSELNIQKEHFNKTLFENQFYGMLDIHRTNVNDLQASKTIIDFDDPVHSKASESEITGIKAFSKILTELELCIKLAKEHFPNNDIKIQIKTAYELFWNGAKEKDKETHSFFREAYHLKEIKYSTILNGQSSQLAHYYRQLFQTVKFVVTQNIFTYEEKRQYLRILRSQLSNEEQVLLFYNWYSTFGKEWQNDKNKFFTDYRMIHNVFPNLLIKEIDLEQIFKNYKPYQIEENRRVDSLFEYQDK